MEHPIQHYYTMLDEVLTDLSINPADARGDQPGQWNLKHGSASVWVDVFQSKDAQGNLLQSGYMQMLAPVCDVPVNNQHIFTKELLEINHSLYGVAFTIFKEKSYIKAIRELQGLDKSEVRATLDRVGIYANDWDDKLKAKYFPPPPGGAFTGGSRG
jgi:hypothetical protein